MSSSSPAGGSPVDDVPAAVEPAPGTVLTRADVAHLAHLARLSVTDEELDRYVGQLSVILESVAAVSEVAAGGAVATKWQAPGSGDPSEQSGTVSEVAAGGAVARSGRRRGAETRANSRAP